MFNYKNARFQGGGYSRGQQYGNSQVQGPQGGNFGNNYGRGYAGGNGGQYVKKSRCGVKDHYFRNGGKERVDAICVNGWSAAHGSFVAVPGGTPSKNERWVSMVITIEPPKGEKFTTNGFWDNDKQRLKFTDYGGGMVANPHAPNGGVWCRGGHPMQKTIQRNQNRR